MTLQERNIIKLGLDYGFTLSEGDNEFLNQVAENDDDYHLTPYERRRVKEIGDVLEAI